LALTVSYLGASLVDCEPPKEWGSVVAGAEAHAPAVVGEGDAMGRSAHSLEAPHASGPSTLASKSGHPAHGSSHDSGPVEPTPSVGKGPVEPRPSVGKGQLELQPTCLCGCSETRSLLGGGASSLGAWVPGGNLAQLPGSQPLPPAALPPLLWQDRLGPSDPIPI
jgi:hypothetical protein